MDGPYLKGRHKNHVTLGGWVILIFEKASRKRHGRGGGGYHRIFFLFAWVYLLAMILNAVVIDRVVLWTC